MNQLNKLIEQYERENPGEKAILYYGFEKDFVEWVIWSFTNSFKHMESQVQSLESRPTCGKEQRKFLDEVEKLKYEVVLGCDGLVKELGKVFDDQPIIYGSDFTVNLQKVIKGK